MKKPLIGLLALDPHRLYVYWELDEGFTGGRYIEDLQPGGVYQVELRRNGETVARSNAVTLPPDSAPAPEAAGATSK
ncbi:MAG: hypothetical protein HY013_09540 [Candidatus Solibacter usitatus]|nr:hypothetical protein [Candidatus Solibacter usitatus]